MSTDLYVARVQFETRDSAKAGAESRVGICERRVIWEVKEINSNFQLHLLTVKTNSLPCLEVPHVCARTSHMSNPAVTPRVRWWIGKASAINPVAGQADYRRFAPRYDVRQIPLSVIQQGIQ